jgi:hypothetical protein
MPCSGCPSGTFSIVVGATSATVCSTCAAGSVTNTLAQPGGTSCTGCAVGRFSPNSTVPCTQCIPGKISVSRGAQACASCPDGSVPNTLAQPGGTSCTACAAGRFSPQSNATMPCSGCPSGTFSIVVGATSATVCSTCAAGSVTNTLQQSMQSGACLVCCAYARVDNHAPVDGDTDGNSDCCAGELPCPPQG